MLFSNNQSQKWDPIIDRYFETKGRESKKKKTLQKHVTHQKQNKKKRQQRVTNQKKNFTKTCQTKKKKLYKNMSNKKKNDTTNP